MKCIAPAVRQSRTYMYRILEIFAGRQPSNAATLFTINTRSTFSIMPIFFRSDVHQETGLSDTDKNNFVNTFSGVTRVGDTRGGN